MGQVLVGKQHRGELSLSPHGEERISNKAEGLVLLSSSRVVVVTLAEVGLRKQSRGGPGQHQLWGL